MTYKSPNPNQKINTKAIAWALFSQSIWLPVLLTDTQDQIASKNSDYDFSGVAANIPNQNLPPLASLQDPPSRPPQSLVAQAPRPLDSSGVILNATLPKESSILSKLHNTIAPLTTPTSPIAFKPSIRPSVLPRPIPNAASQSDANHRVRSAGVRGDAPPSDLLRGLYSRSDLLGGVLTLGNLNDPLMPPIARAEQAQSIRSGDPLSAIPKMWREPMRQALKNLSETLKPPTNPLNGKPTTIAVEQARVIHVPSSRVKRVSEVPLALQSDGTVDILNSPDDPEVVEEIKTWSSKQKLPDRGRMAPAVVHLHPIPEQEQAPASERVTHASPQPTELQTPQLQSAVEEPAPPVPAPAPAPVVHQEASVPEVVPSHPSPTPPPPIETSSLPPLEAEATIAEVPAEVSVPSNNGVVQ